VVCVAERVQLHTIERRLGVDEDKESHAGAIGAAYCRC
jgi:hypothetical protein